MPVFGRFPRRRCLGWLCPGLLVLSLVLCGGTARAQSPSGAFGSPERSVGFDVGFQTLQTILNNKHQPWAIGGGPQVGLRYQLDQQWDGYARFGLLRLWDDVTTTSTIKLPSGDKSSMVWTMLPIRIGLQRTVAEGTHFSEYIHFGGGVNIWSVEDQINGGTFQVNGPFGDSTDFSAVEPMVTVGLGIKRKLGRSTALDARFGFSYLMGITTNFGDSTNNYRSRGMLSLTIGVTGLFGGGTPDVFDPYESGGVSSPPIEAQDIAPDSSTTSAPQLAGDDTAASEETPLPVDDSADRAGAEAARIELEQSEEDDDGDGIANFRDLCPETPPGIEVDTEGCPRDADGDGVYDQFDQCPGTPPQVLVDAQGCPMDTDGDGVFDGWDECPDTPPEAHATIDQKGCPSDEDADGVPDYRDACPETPPGPDVDPDGCRDTDGDGIHDGADRCNSTPNGLAVDETGCLVMTQLQRRLLLFVSYVSGTSDIDLLSKAILDDVMVRMTRAPNADALIEGFTDNIGEADANLALSQKRAEKIRQYLIDGGIAPDRLEAVGHGESKFLGDNETASGRRRNRRIEISFRRR